MPLFLTDDQAMLRDTAREFVADTAPVSHLRALRPGVAVAWRTRPRAGLPVVLQPGSRPAYPTATGAAVSSARVGRRQSLWPP